MSALSAADLALQDEEAQLAADLEPEFERRQWRISVEHHGQRLDRVVSLLVPEFSRNHLQGLIEAGEAQVDQRPVTVPSRKLKAGQHVSLRLVPTAESLAFQPQSMALDVVYEDADVLVLNKPAGLVVHPAPGNWSGTLLNGLLARDPKAASLPRAGIVHRLDKDTSGLMVVGRSLEAVTALTRDMALRVIKRRYLALVHGDVGPAPFRVDLPIGRDPVSRIRMAVAQSGKPAQTDVIRLGYRAGVSAVRCQLHTGRTHQIRVHLQQQGHPLVGDTLYGGQPALGMVRQALHATQLGFPHPIRRENLAFEAGPPDDFLSAWLEVADGLAIKP